MAMETEVTPAGLRIARVLMWAALGIWSVWVGGQVYHEMMVLPIWRLNPPESIARYAEVSRGARTAPFFLIFSTAWPTLLSGAAAISAARSARRPAIWAAGFAVLGLGITVVLVGWLAPTIQGLFRGEYDTAEVGAAAFAWWDRANTARLWLEVVTMLVGARAAIGLSRARGRTAGCNDVELPTAAERAQR